jgi:hypothetical protein
VRTSGSGDANVRAVSDYAKTTRLIKRSDMTASFREVAILNIGGGNASESCGRRAKRSTSEP